MRNQFTWVLLGGYVLLFVFTFKTLPCILNSNDNADIRQERTISTEQFNPNKHGLVFFHIEKTSGSNFDLQIVENLLKRNKANNDWSRACFEHEINSAENYRIMKNMQANGGGGVTARYACQIGLSRENWYISRLTQIRWHCGVHPFFAEFKDCVLNTIDHMDKLYFFTLLRNPVHRFVSEWAHLSRMDHMNPRLFQPREQCKENYATHCERGWAELSSEKFDIFLSCKYNLAANRQTRMLALYDASFTLCNYADTWPANETMDEELLIRAKRGLESMVFFGLAEHQSYNQILFEKVMGSDQFKFNVSIVQSSNSNAFSAIKALHPNQLNRAKKLNHLDFRLFEFAEKLFFQRLKFYGII